MRRCSAGLKIAGRFKGCTECCHKARTAYVRDTYACFTHQYRIFEMETELDDEFE